MEKCITRQIGMIGLLLLLLTGCKSASTNPQKTDKPPVLTPTLGNSIGLLGEWRLDGNVDDSSGNSNNGALIASAVYTTGKQGQGIDLRGNGSYVKVPESPILMDGISGLTVSAWVYIHQLPKPNTYYAPVAKEHSYRFIISPDGYAHFVVATTQNSWYSDGTAASYKSRIEPGVWYHMAATYNGQYLQVYLNGKPDGRSKTISGAICAHAKPMGRNTIEINSPITFGANIAGNIDFTNGIVDEVRIYNRALSSEEVLSLYNTH